MRRPIWGSGSAPRSCFGRPAEGAKSPGSQAPSFGSPRRHFRVADSTNERARDLVLAGAPSGTVVTAAVQTAGRGRRGRQWTGPPGKALLCSAVLHPLGRQHALLPLAVPLAVCEAVDTLAPLDCRVKWPNDLWVGERKLGGVLIEAQPPDWAVIGIGLNVAIEPDEFPADLRHPATSVGHGVGVEAALAAVCERLGDWVDAGPDQVIEEFGRRDALRGREVSWQGAGGTEDVGAGVADGIDERGNLVVVTSEGESVSLGSGEVSLSLNGA
jgi:BirA family transcriptional regulator, biotin operon repressor / biotin---[acetyl-CoA-carboxylase] ligase